MSRRTGWQRISTDRVRRVSYRILAAQYNMDSVTLTRSGAFPIWVTVSPNKTAHFRLRSKSRLFRIPGKFAEKFRKISPHPRPSQRLVKSLTKPEQRNRKMWRMDIGLDSVE